MGPGIPLSPRPNPPFRLHQVAQNIVNAGQVSCAFGTQPIAFPEQCLCRPADSLTRRLADLQIITLPWRTISIGSLSGNRGQTVVEWRKRLSGYSKALSLRPVCTGRDPPPTPLPRGSLRYLFAFFCKSAPNRCRISRFRPAPTQQGRQPESGGALDVAAISNLHTGSSKHTIIPSPAGKISSSSNMPWRFESTCRVSVCCFLSRRIVTCAGLP